MTALFRWPITRSRLREGDVHLASQTQTAVLITAASREHRETYARLIHSRADGGSPGPFVTFEVNGPSPLRHYFGQAVGGALFIDDVAALTINEQAELFLLLQCPPVSPGSPQPGSRVRVIAGASRHLDSERASGAFSEQLFYRLNAIHIDLLDHHVLN